MSGTLYLVATPIGNLEDMTFRAVRVLKEVDLVAAEDTRNSRKLMTHFDIATPMTSYHEYNRFEKAAELVEKLLGSMDVACITDAGTPGISDPGEELVRQCVAAGVPVVPVPGACAAVNALIASGLPTRRFAFEAFLPADKKERARVLKCLKSETRTIVLYEAPHRLSKTLDELLSALGDREITLCRELTKKHEEFFKTTISGAINHFKESEPRGEYVLVLAGTDFATLEAHEQAKWDSISIEDHIQKYLDEGLSKKDAIKQVATDRGVPKREIYDVAINM